ncbi:hypothetical protein K435DRAFT_759365 [Dendrothele bispora CBS 962.96]|uniref:HMG box domain-containing protein n=1 Tax=Dendrothele bispora (strain CBS 962.96) TaxID=1314807 RepID=A0A4V4HEJ0_DENBC|nr:hypothetical protein K435DRAFT_759365 [Dendrothele bispora CBS 962.96]
MWRELPEAEKDQFRKEAEQVKKEHKMKYPDYQYAPQSKKTSSGVRRRKDRDSLDCKEIAKRMTFTTQVSVELEQVVVVQERQAHEATPVPLEPIKMEEAEVTLGHSHVAETSTFVPTEDIPPLDLASSSLVDNETNSRMPKDVTKQTSFFSSESLVPPSYLYIDSQFGSNPATIPLHRESLPDYELEPSVFESSETQMSLLFSDATNPTPQSSSSSSFVYSSSTTSIKTSFASFDTLATLSSPLAPSVSIPNPSVELPKTSSLEDNLNYLHDAEELAKHGFRFLTSPSTSTSTSTSAGGLNATLNSLNSSPYEEWPLDLVHPDESYQSIEYQIETLDDMFEQFIGMPSAELEH